MKNYLFAALLYFLLFLLMCGTLCAQVYANGVTEASDANNVELFNKKSPIKNAKKPNKDTGEDVSDVEVKSFYSPVFVFTNNVFVALAGVNRMNEENNIYIVTNYTEKNKLLESKDLASTKDNWTPQFAVQKEVIEGAKEVVKGLLAVAKGDEIYLLSVNYIKKTTGDPNDFNFALYFVDGAVNKAEPKEIEWKKPALTDNTVVEQLKKEFNDQQESDFLFSGSAFLIDEEKIVFALVVAKDKQKKKNGVCANTIKRWQNRITVCG